MTAPRHTSVFLRRNDRVSARTAPLPHTDAGRPHGEHRRLGPLAEPLGGYRVRSQVVRATSVALTRSDVARLPRRAPGSGEDAGPVRLAPHLSPADVLAHTVELFPKADNACLHQKPLLRLNSG